MPWAALLFTLLASPALQAQVVINEIFYHPASEDVREEYLELLNTGTGVVSLDGWQFSNGIKFTFTNASLAAGGYLVVAADLSTFTNAHPGVTNVVGNWTGRLSNSDEDLDLDDATGQRVDSVHYADEGDWAVRQRGPLDHNHRGWLWNAAHDGGGSSLELINPRFSNNHGQNWAASLATNGTPGTVNSVFQTNIAPVIIEVQHLPPVPSSVDPVLVTARLVDDQGANVTATVHWRVDGATSFTSASLYDDGLHDDGSPTDGVFAATLPAQPADTVVEFYLEATDADLLTRTWPAATLDENGAPSSQRANVLYQVDDSTYSGAMPLYKLIMKAADRDELVEIGSSSNGEQNTDAQMNGTFISLDGSGTSVRYTTGIRNRGHGSRKLKPNNYRVNFTSDRRWKRVTAININGQYTHAQIAGAALSLKSGLPGAESRPAQVRVNNANLGNNGPQTYGGTYAINEVINSDWTDHWLPNDSAANVYRALRDSDPHFNYRGTNPAAYTNTWFKTTNESEDYWTDLIAMLRVMGTNDLFSAEAVRTVVDVDEWMTYLAVMALLNNQETSPNTGDNDDYFGYAGVNDPRFRLMPYDHDTILGQGNTTGSTTYTIFGAAAAGEPFNLTQFMYHPEFEPVYYRTLQHLLDTTFSEAEFNATLDQTLGDFVPASTITEMKTWMANRRAYVQSIVTPYIAALSNAPVATVSATPRSPTPLVTASLVVGGEGVSQYRYALNDGLFGPATPVASPIALSGLAHGSTNVVRVIGTGTNGLWQAETDATMSAAWVVNTNWPAVRINEALAANLSAFNHEGTFPDAIELHNEGAAPVDLSGMRLSDKVSSPNKFTFPNGTTLGAGAYLVVLANDADGTTGHHTGFSLRQEGEGVFLFDSISSGNALLDSVEFGLQLEDHSIGRVDGGAFILTQPTFGTNNVMQPVADPQQLRINEWLASGFALVPEDFIELYNPSPLPCPLSDLYLTDNPIGDVTRHQIPSLSFLSGSGLQWLIADGKPGDGADHVDFKLSSEQGLIALLTAELEMIDCVVYGPQRTDVSQGRTPDGGNSFLFFAEPSPGAPNAGPPLPCTVTSTGINLMTLTHTWRCNQTDNLDGVNWAATNYDDAAWPSGPGLLAYETDAWIGSMLGTTLLDPKNVKSPQGTAYYFRTTLVVTNDLTGTTVTATARIDDGAIVYVNGVAVSPRIRMNTGSILFTDFANGLPPGGDATADDLFTIPTSLFVPGANVIAAEVHQVNATSSDIVWGMALDATRWFTNCEQSDVVLNEVLANNQSFTNASGRTPDWIELFNASTNTVDLSDRSLTDNVSTPRKWIFPPAISLPPGGRVVIECDDTLPGSATNTGFGLSAGGDAVYLFERPAEGGAILDSVVFGLQAEGFSIGRFPDGAGNWELTLPTARAANVGAGLGNASLLKINEWMASPAEGDDWFELHNPNPQPVALAGLAVTDDATVRDKSLFPPLSFIGPAGFVKLVADDNTAAGADHAGFKLDATGDFIGLYRPTGTQIDGVSFGGQAAGVSQGRFLDGASSIANFTDTASPGAPNYLPLTNVVINELLSHTDPPLEDAVEIHNLATTPLDIGGWYLSNTGHDPRKFLIPSNTVIAAGGFQVFYENQFGTNTDPGVLTPFNFNSAHGDEVHLSQTDSGDTLTGYRASAAFEASANGLAFGRFLTSAGGEFVAMSAHSFGVTNPVSLAQFRTGLGATNPYPRVGPVIFSEIQYQPTNDYAGDTNDAEFLELRNITADPVPMFDPAAMTNTWSIRGGVEFEFPMNVTLPANASLLVVSFDPVADTARSNWFHAVYSMPAGVTLLGPWSGALANEGETVALYRPDPPQSPSAPDAGFVPQILIERVAYQPVTPWPTNGIGSGASLHRSQMDLFGNEPANWFAATPSAGTDTPLDSDGDQLPDWWEIENGLNPASPNGVDGASGNLDGDPFTNLEEWLAGTRADDSSDYLHILSASVTPGGVTIQFSAAGGRTHSVLWSASPAGPWTRLADAPFSSSNVVVGIVDPTLATGGARFYKVVTPAQEVP